VLDVTIEGAKIHSLEMEADFRNFGPVSTLQKQNTYPHSYKSRAQKYTGSTTAAPQLPVHYPRSETQYVCAWNLSDVMALCNLNSLQGAAQNAPLST